MTTYDEVRAEIEIRREFAGPHIVMREALPVNDPLQLPAAVRSGDVSPLDDVLRRFRLHGLGVGAVF